MTKLILLASLTLLAGGAYAAQAALDLQDAAYAHPPRAPAVLMVVGSPEELLDH